MTDLQILELYIQVARVIGEMFAPFVETVVHDYRKPNESIIAIFNGHVTRRKVGEGTSDLGRRRLKSLVPDVLVNYENISPSGKPLKSSAIGIRNEKGQIIGALGINMDTSYFGEFSNFIESFITPKKSKHILEHEKFYYVKASDEVRSTLKKVLIENGWHSQRLSPEQKSKLMRTLHEKGVFNMRGSVATVAAELNLTRPSIYKYIRQVAPPK